MSRPTGDPLSAACRLMCRALNHRLDTPCQATATELMRAGAERIADLTIKLNTARENLARLAAEGPMMTMTTDRIEIRNSADEDVPSEPTCPTSCTFSGHEMAHKVSGKLAEALVDRVNSQEYIRLFNESQEVARTAVAEVKRLRMFISEEFFMDAKKSES